MFNLPFFTKKKSKLRPTVLVILDGFGLAPASAGNAISLAKTPNYNYLLKNYPHGELIASGESVGLPANEVGNTEVGHLTLGAGRVILQDLNRINLAIEKGTFYDNKVFLQATAHIKANNSKLHIMGLIGSGNVHSSMSHLYALLQFCKKEEIGRVYLHLFTDGRDSPQKEGLEVIQKLEKHLQMLHLGVVASICGRYFGMDRDRRWERTQKAYNAIVLGQGFQTTSISNAVQGAYDKGQTDEFIEPIVLLDKNIPVGVVEDNDALIFFNYRIDRPRQLSMALTLPNFESLMSFDFGYNPETSKSETDVKLGQTFVRTKVVKNLFFVTMTEYHNNIPVSGIAYPPEVVEKSLAETISQIGLKQAHMAESEKERFVTYYFDGLREGKFPGENAIIVPSPKVPTYDKKPEMALCSLVSEFKRQLKRDLYSFFVINFANPDMVAHSGNLKATITAVQEVDKYLGQLVAETLASEGTVVITADHGNAEELLSFPTSTFYYTSATGSINTDHSANPVPVIIANKNLSGNATVLKKGSLADIAPTILNITGISVPSQMSGRNLLAQ